MRKIKATLVFTLSFLLSVVQTMGEPMVIDDFSSGADKRWRFFADTVMGGVSSGDVAFRTEDDVSFARLSGSVSTANNGGFIQIRHTLEAPPTADITGIRLIVRGNGQRYYIHLRTPGTLLPWQYYQAPFESAASWREVRLPLSAFTPSGRMLRGTPKATSLRSVAIVAFGRDHEAQVDVQEIGFY